MTPNVIVDYHLGNIHSIHKACEHAGLKSVISSEPEQVRNSRLLILPGVGAFGRAMSNLGRLDLIEPIVRHVREGKPFVGICLGMQLLFGQSDEFGGARGLGLMAGLVKRLPAADRGVKRRVPHMGWNLLRTVACPQREPLLAHLDTNTYAYFVHSYYAAPEDPSVITAFAEHQGFRFCAAVRQENVCGMQFHPEKSGPDGLSIIAKIKKEMVS